MSYQVRDACYPTASQAAFASASGNIGNVIVIGGNAFVTDVTAVTDTSITYTFLGVSSSLVQVSPYSAVPCGLLDAGDGALMGWGVVAAWVAVYGLMFLLRGLRGEAGGDYGNA